MSVGQKEVYYMGMTMETFFIPFPHIDAFWPLCNRQLFENIVTKEEIAQNDQFLLLPQRFQLFTVIKPSLKDIFCVFV